MQTLRAIEFSAILRDAPDPDATPSKWGLFLHRPEIPDPESVLEENLKTIGYRIKSITSTSQARPAEVHHKQPEEFQRIQSVGYAVVLWLAEGPVRLP